MRKALLPLFVLFASLATAQQKDSQIDRIQPPAEQSDLMTLPADPWSGSRDVAPEEAFASAAADTNAGQFYVDFQVRSRGEYRNGQGTLRSKGTLPTWFINDRERISMGYSREHLSAKASIHHVGVWGDRGMDGKYGEMQLKEAWARLELKGWFLQLGRQVLSYDDERIFGAQDWTVSGYSHDALRIGYERGLHKVHGITNFHQEKERRIGGAYYDGAMAYKSMMFLWYHYGNDSKPFQFSILAMDQGLEIGYKANNVEHPSTGYMQMFGGWFQYRANHFIGKAEGYYQTGHDENQRVMAAYLGAVRLGFESQPFGMSLGADYVSGAKTSIRRGTNRCFNLLYGSTHDFYGAMDYFVSGNMLTCGLLDGLLNVYVRPARNLRLDVSCHNFMMGVKREGLGMQLGQELDARLRYDIMKDVALEAGYSFMLPTENLEYFKDGNRKSWQDWGWISLNISPRILTLGHSRK